MDTLKITTQKTWTYKYSDGFMVDITKHDNIFEAWLYHKDYGIKELVFGVDVSDVPTLEEFAEMVQGNLENENDIDGYIEDYMD